MPEAIVISVLVMDHNPILLEGLSFLIKSEPDMVLVGAASNLQDGLALMMRTHADCILIDLDLDSAAGFEFLTHIRQADATSIIIGLITYELDNHVSKALASGVSAIVSKDQISQTLVELIRQLSRTQSD